MKEHMKDIQQWKLLSQAHQHHQEFGHNFDFDNVLTPIVIILFGRELVNISMKMKPIQNDLDVLPITIQREEDIWASKKGNRESELWDLLKCFKNNYLSTDYCESYTVSAQLKIKFVRRFFLIFSMVFEKMGENQIFPHFLREI